MALDKLREIAIEDRAAREGFVDEGLAAQTSNTQTPRQDPLLCVSLLNCFPYVCWVVEQRYDTVSLMYVRWGNNDTWVSFWIGRSQSTGQ